MKHIFVDLGCYNGDSTEQFRNWSKLAFGRDIVWDIYAFDPTPHHTRHWTFKTDKNTKFIQKAAWICDGEIEFSHMLDQGSTVMKGKKNYGSGGTIKVDCFDFSEWLKQFAGEFIVVKMDIEGAEFPVLEKMIKDDTDLLVKHLLVEFHPNKVVEYTTTNAISLKKKLQGRGVDIMEWH